MSFRKQFIWHYLKQEVMMFYILLISFLSTTCVVGDAELQPIKMEDFNRILDSVKKDVHRHLKMAYDRRNTQSISFLDSPELDAAVGDAENGEEYRIFMKMIQDSLHHHLVGNLGQPSDAENDGSTVNMKPTPESTGSSRVESTSEQVLKHADEDQSEESSSQIYEIRVDSTKGVPGVDFPDYTDIPITSFTCSEKPHFPGFYADLDTGCQVFHVCRPDRRETFLCPMGTTFNQALGICDSWYNSNCSLAPYYYSVNAEVEPDLSKDRNEGVSSKIRTLLEKADSASTQRPGSSTYSHATSVSAVPFISQFIPVKAKIVVYPKTETQRLKIVTTASVGESKESDLKQKLNQRNSYTSKHSRVPRSLKFTKSTTNTNIVKLSLERLMFRLNEAFDRAVKDIENDETWSRLSVYARSAVKGIKSTLSLIIGKPLKDIGPEPGSELYEEDMKMKTIQEGLREVFKYIIILKADLMEKYQKQMKRKPKFSKDIHERKTLTPEPLTNLNPRFIIKPAIEQRSNVLSSGLPIIDNKGKRSATIPSPLKISKEDSLIIHPETKRILLKSYLKLFKERHKLA